ncbi:MAG: hypothetical protein ABIE43_02905 [Patescibacteria group bacterium]
MEINYRKKFIGKELGVVVERIFDKKEAKHPIGCLASTCIGKTEYYFDVEFGLSQIKTDKNIIGKIIKVKIEKYN